MATENIVNKFGSCVVLDATATINEIYETTSWYNQNTFKHIITEDSRVYSNFTISKAKGYPQGADSVYAKLDANEKRDRANEYLSIAYEIVSSEEDKMLIIGHKDFVLTLQSLNTNNQIVFTNWGNHVGKNNWSDCNKVMVIGWLYKPETEYYGNFINAVGNLEHASHAIRDSTRNLYRETQLADDLVQAVMRCSARKTVSEDGNCAAAEVYIFYPNNKEGKRVLKLFELEFKEAVIKKWTPKFKNVQQKITKHEANVRSIMKYLKQASKKVLDISQSDIVKATGLAKSIISRTLASDECVEEFNRLGYTKVVAIGKPTIIHFS